MNRLQFTFNHGLGDAANFAHMIPLYLRRGYEIAVNCTPDKACIFAAAGAEIVPNAPIAHPWYHWDTNSSVDRDKPWWGNKAAWSFDHANLPPLGLNEDMWQEYLDVKLDFSKVAPQEPFVLPFCKTLWFYNTILIQAKGTNSQEHKNLSDKTIIDLCERFLDTTDYGVVLLDWDNRIPRFANSRLLHLRKDVGLLDVPDLWRLMEASSLLISVDSGPMHFSRFSKVPLLGVWTGFHPANFSVPRKGAVHLVPSRQRQRSIKTRLRWNIVEYDDKGDVAAQIAETAQAMLSPTHYVSSEQWERDVQLRQFVQEFCRGKNGALSPYVDRNRGFDTVLLYLRGFKNPQIVETGTARGAEDWGGAGFSTYLFGAYLRARDAGHLDSVDIDGNNVAFAREACKELDRVTVHQSDSVAWLAARKEPIDFLYLDSMDTTVRGFEEHALKEIQTAYPLLTKGAMVGFDDTVWDGKWVGKGALAVPWLLEQGWRIVHSGYQTILVRA